MLDMVNVRHTPYGDYMKFILALTVLITSQLTLASAVTGMNCLGTSITFHDDGDIAEDTQLMKVEGNKHYSLYAGESKIFKFYVDHRIEKKTVSLTITDKKNELVLSKSNMTVARFNVSIGGYWLNHFTSLKCSPIR